MDKILQDIGMQQFIPVFNQKSITLKTFKYIMGSNKSADQTRKIVMEDTGLTTGQIVEICSEIGELETKLANGSYHHQQQVVRPNQAYNKTCEQQYFREATGNGNPYPRTQNLTSSYGRSNRISRLVQQPQKKPQQLQMAASSTIPNFLGARPAQTKSQERPPVQQIEQVQAQTIEENPENIQCENGIVQIDDQEHSQQRLQLLDNKASQEYVMEKLNDLSQQRESVSQDASQNDNEVAYANQQYVPRKIDSPQSYEESRQESQSEVQKHDIMPQVHNFQQQNEELENDEQSDEDYGDENPMDQMVQNEERNYQMQALQNPEESQDVEQNLQEEQDMNHEMDYQFMPNHQDHVPESSQTSSQHSQSNSVISDAPQANYAQDIVAEEPKLSQPLQQHQSRPTVGLKQPVSQAFKYSQSSTQVDQNLQQHIHEQRLLHLNENVSRSESNILQQNQQHTEKSLSDPEDEDDSDDSGSQLSIQGGPKPQQGIHQMGHAQQQKDYNEETSSQEDQDEEEDELPSESNYKEHVEKIRQSQLRDQQLWGQRRDDMGGQSQQHYMQHSENHQSSRNEMQQFKDSEYDEAEQPNTFAHSIHMENMKRQQKGQQVISNISKQHSQNSHNTFLAGGDQNKNIAQMVIEQSNLSSNFNIMHVKSKMVEESNQPMILDDPHQVIMSEIRHSQIESSKSLNQIGDQYSSTSQRQIQAAVVKPVCANTMYDQYSQINIKPEQRDAENQVFMDSLKQQIRSELIDEVKREQISALESKQQESIMEFQSQINKIQQLLFQKQQEFSDSKQLIQNLQQKLNLELQSKLKVETDKTEMQQRIAGYENQIRALHEQDDQNQGIVETLNSSLNKLRDENQKLLKAKDEAEAWERAQGEAREQEENRRLQLEREEEEKSEQIRLQQEQQQQAVVLAERQRREALARQEAEKAEMERQKKMQVEKQRQMLIAAEEEKQRQILLQAKELEAQKSRAAEMEKLMLLKKQQLILFEQQKAAIALKQRQEQEEADREAKIEMQKRLEAQMKKEQMEKELEQLKRIQEQQRVAEEEAGEQQRLMEEQLKKQREAQELEKKLKEQQLQSLLREKERQEQQLEKQRKQEAEMQTKLKEEQQAKEKQQQQKEKEEQMDMQYQFNKNEYIKSQQEMIKKLEQEKQKLMKQTEEYKQKLFHSSQMSQVSANKSNVSRNEDQQSTINLMEEDDSPRRNFMQHLKEESSFLPDYVAPQKNEQKRIIKKVRFHDDESEQIQGHVVIEDDEDDHNYQQSSDDDKVEDEFDVAKVGQKRHRLTRSRMTRQGARTLTKLINQEDAESDSLNQNNMAAATTESQTSLATVPTSSTTQIVTNPHKRPKHSDDEGRLKFKRKWIEDASKSEDQDWNTENGRMLKNFKKLTKSPDNFSSAQTSTSKTIKPVSNNRDIYHQKMQDAITKINPEVQKNNHLMKMIQKIASSAPGKK